MTTKTYSSAKLAELFLEQHNNLPYVVTDECIAELSVNTIDVLKSEIVAAAIAGYKIVEVDSQWDYDSEAGVWRESKV